jgi:hypothetical protein
MPAPTGITLVDLIVVGFLLGFGWTLGAAVADWLLALGRRRP